MNRREFLQTSGSAALAVSGLNLIKPSLPKQEALPTITLEIVTGYCKQGGEEEMLDLLRTVNKPLWCRTWYWDNGRLFMELVFQKDRRYWYPAYNVFLSLIDPHKKWSRETKIILKEEESHGPSVNRGPVESSGNQSGTDSV